MLVCQNLHLRGLLLLPLHLNINCRIILVPGCLVTVLVFLDQRIEVKIPFDLFLQLAGLDVSASLFTLLEDPQVGRKVFVFARFG